MYAARPYLALIFTCMIVLIIFLGPAVHATSSYTIPWMNEHSVKTALTQQEGQTVVVEAMVMRTAARNNPPYFVLRDEIRTNNEPESRIVVLCRPPLCRIGLVRVTGTLGRLPNNELCILNPVVEGLFDQQGQPVYWAPLPGFTVIGNWQALPIPTGPIPPSDPSLVDDGMGITGEVSAYTTEEVSQFDTVASLLAAAPPVLTRVTLTCKPVMDVGDGFIIIGDDLGASTVKAYTDSVVGPTDRVIALNGVTHSENGKLVIYAGAGPSPFYDFQGTGGSVSVAKVGSVAYAGTLSDPRAAAGSNGAMSMGASSPSSSDGSWVYLTGQVVTFIGEHYFNSIPSDDWVSVYNIQGIDRTPGMRVWSPAIYRPDYAGSIVDVMAKVDTKDGQRMLGVWCSEEWDAVDSSSSSHCIELSVLTGTDLYNPPNLVPVGIANRDLCGVGIGFNPGVSSGQGAYNVGSYVTVWGKVLETGTYQFDQNGFCQTPYMVIDDGSSVPNADPGITVFGTITSPFNWLAVGDYVSVTGVSSIWKPDGSSETYRSVWTSDGAIRQTGTSRTVSRVTTSTGTISGTVKLYDMPNNQAVVNVYCTNGGVQTLVIPRDGDGSGSKDYTFTNVPKVVEVTVHDPLGDYSHNEYPQYIVSATCADYKTRTHTQITPWTGTETPRNIYLPRLRKIYVTTDNTSIDPYSDSAVITATVVDSGRNPIQGATVRFRTNKGSFSSDSVDRDYAPESTTDTRGQVTATLYRVPSEWGYDVVVEATDDSAPLIGDDLADDPYKYDWVQLHDEYGQPCTIVIERPSTDLELTADPVTIDLCGTIQSAITARITGGDGSSLDGIDVTFSNPNPGLFSDNSTRQTVTTKDGGYATVYLKGNGTTGVAIVTATAYPYGAYTSRQTPSITITTDTLTLSANPVVGQIGQSVAITANVKDAAGNDISGREVYFSQTGGSPPELGTIATNASGNAEFSVSRSTAGKVTLTAYEDMPCGVRMTKTVDVWFYDTTPDDWPMFMHDPQHTGMSSTWDISGETLTREWVVDLPTADTERIAAWSYLDPSTGETISHPSPTITHITHMFEHPYIDSSPVVIGNKLIVGTWTRGTRYPFPGEQAPATGSVKAFDAASGGTTLWTATGVPSMGGVVSTPCISDGRVYVGTTNGYFYCLDLNTGSQIWARQTTNRSAAPGNSPIISSPVVHNGVVYITNEASKVYAFTADSSGTLVAGYPIVLPIDQPGHGDQGNGVTDVRQQNICGASSPAVATVGGNTYLLVGCDDGYVYRIDLRDRTLAMLNVGGCVESSPSVSGDYAYIGVSIFEGENLQRITVDPFERAGSWYLGEESRATASLAYGYIYNGVDTGHVFYRVQDPISDPDIGLLPQFDAGNYFVGSAAHTTGGIVYTGNDNGHFYALDANDLHAIVPDGYYCGSTENPGFICSSPAIGYNVDAEHNRWVFITTRSDGGKLYAFKTVR